MTGDGRLYVVTQACCSIESKPSVVSVIDTTAVGTGTDSVIAALRMPDGYGAPRSVAVNSDGSEVYVGLDPIDSQSTAAAIMVIANTPTPSIVGTYELGPMTPDPWNPAYDVTIVSASQLVVSRNGKKVYFDAYYSDGFQRTGVFDTASRTLIDTDGDVKNGITPLEANPSTGLTLSPDGKRLYASSNPWGEGEVSVIDTDTDTVIAYIQTGQATFPSVVVTPDNSRVIAETDSGLVWINAATNAVEDQLPMTGLNNLTNLTISGDGQRLYVTTGYANAAAVNTVDLDAEYNPISSTPIPMNQQPVGLAISGDGARLYVSTQGIDLENRSNAEVVVVDTTSNTVIGSPITLSDQTVAVGDSYPGLPNRAIAVSEDGARLYLLTHGTSNNLSVIDTGVSNDGSSGGDTGQGTTVGTYLDVSVSSLLDGIPKTADTMRVDVVGDPETRTPTGVIVYMMGVSDEPASIADAAYSNASGAMYPKAMAAIDDYIAKGFLQNVPIMLVGYSNGGQQMQIYATSGEYRSSVSTVVTFASPLIKKTSEFADNAYVVNVQADNDWVPGKFTHPDVRQSYVDDPNRLLKTAQRFINWGNFNIFGWHPFGFLLTVGRNMQAKAQDQLDHKIIYTALGDKSLPGFPNTAVHQPSAYADYAAAFDTAAEANDTYAGLRDDLSRFDGLVLYSTGDLTDVRP